jgi:hypothetical protein
MCDLHMCMWRYDHADVVLTLFRSISYNLELIDMRAHHVWR